VTEKADELALMQSIRFQWKPQLEIAASGTAIPEAFLAALVANESGGEPDAKRFEPGVLGKLWEVLLDRKPRYGSIAKPDLSKYVQPTELTTTAESFRNLDDLATSWGLTQIMGYHILEWGSIPGWYRSVDDLRMPDRHLQCTALLLTQFANRFELDLSTNFSELLHCWNSGTPTGQTFDPEYVPNGLSRMELYSSLGG
jgi:hypothetical protein